MHTRKAHRALIVLALALAVLMATRLWPSRARRRAAATATEPEGPAPESALARPPDPARPDPTPKATAVPQPPDPPPVIDEVTVEKPSVCSGEENLITVRAHTVNGTDAFLHYVVDGAMGSSVPLRLLLGEDGRVEGKHVIRVFGRTNVVVTVPVPAYEVMACQPQRAVVIEPRVMANTWSEFDFLAKVVALPPPAPDIRSEGSGRDFAPVSYSWAFGDGEAATTPGPFASHDYERRAQDSLYSYFTVRVDVRDAGGQVLTGRATLPLINPAFEAFAQKGIVQLLIALAPRFPELGPDGRVVQGVRLWHSDAEPVTIDAVALTRYFEGASGETQAEPVDVAALLGATTVPPGRDGITTSVVLDTITEPGVFSMTYRLSGHSKEGRPVMGSFSVMRPPPRPTADNSQAVLDPGLRAKIVAAREILGKDTVSDEEIWQLERQGRLADRGPSGVAPAVETMRPMRPFTRPPALPDPGAPTRGPPVPLGVTPPPAVTAPEREATPDLK